MSEDDIEKGAMSQILGNELSFTSDVPLRTSGLNQITYESPHKYDSFPLKSKFTDTPDEFDYEDGGDGEDREVTEGFEYDATGLAIPRLRHSMTPWRPVDSSAKTNSKQSSPTNSRPTTRNSLFSAEGGYTVASATGSHELELLQKQLTTYKLKVRTLLELIKQLNYGDDEQKARESFYGNLLATMSQIDEIEELKKGILELETDNEDKQKLVNSLQAELDLIKKRLVDTKEEHAETLEYANEYLEHSEVLAKNIDEMLTLLLENLDVSEQERDALQKARQISSSFAMVKMNAVMSTFKRVLQQLKNAPAPFDSRDNTSSPLAAIANSTAINDPGDEVASCDGPSPISGCDINVNSAVKDSSYALDESAIDTKLEIAIEGLHEEYDNFIQGIREKLEKSALLEKLLLEKLSEQDRVLERLSSKIRHDLSTSVAPKDTVLIATGNADTNEGSKDADVSDAYQKHISTLNGLVEDLKHSLNEKNQDWQLLKDQLQEFERLRKSEYRLKIELQDHKNLSKVKERNWENFSADLEKNVHILQNEKGSLLDMVDQLSAEVDVKNEELEKAAVELKKEVRSSNRQLSIQKDKYHHLEGTLRDRESNITELTIECERLQQMISELRSRAPSSKKSEVEFQKFKQHLLLHLETMFITLGKILQKKSIDQSMRKLELIRRGDNKSGLKTMQAKLESLYNFVETALESIVESYMRMVIAEKDKKRWENEGNKLEMQLRIDELERKWIAERERRKLDNDAAETRIDSLEAENELLREKLYNMTVRR